MLKPSMQELMKRVGNRYLLVNLAAQRARDIAEQAEETGEDLPDKAVKLALDEIAAGEIVYRPGPRIEPVIVQNNAIAASMVDVGDSIDLDEDDMLEDAEDSDVHEQADEARRLDEFDDEELDDGDVPEEDR
nr:DNA-directed RNA polymerase subunit omega [uncultured Agathobaculum sp.]